METAIIIALAALAIVLLAFASIRIVQEYERGVIFRLGRLVGAKGPGLFFLIPIADRMRVVDLRIRTLEVLPQEVITRDNVTVKVNAVVLHRVLDPESAIVRAVDYLVATSQIAQTTLRSVLGQSDLDELLSQREQINQRLQRIIDEQTEPWGVKVSVVEIKDVELPTEMRRAMARQAEAEREKRAKVIHAEGEYQAAEQLVAASAIIATQPQALQLRYLQTLRDMATEKTTTIVFPLPLDMLSAFLPRPALNSQQPGGPQGSGT